MTTNFKITTNYFINNLTCQLFIQKKYSILLKIQSSITNIDRDCSFNLCSTYNTTNYLENDIEKAINRYNQLNINEHNNIIEVLLDKNYSLEYNTILYLKEQLQKKLILDMVETQRKITNYINNHIFTKILKIENNQKLLINNQKMLMESMNQINGMNYTIQVNN